MSEDISTSESSGQEAESNAGSAGGMGSVLTDASVNPAGTADTAERAHAGSESPAAGTDTRAEATPSTPEAAPEVYEFVGADELDPGVIDAFKDFSKASGLNNSQAQAVLNLAVSQNKAARDELVKQEQQWRTQLLSDPDIGGDNIGATVGYARRALSHYGDTGKIKDLLDKSGYGSDPDVMRFLCNIGKGISEDTPPSAGISGKEELPLHERMYPPSK